MSCPGRDPPEGILLDTCLELFSSQFASVLDMFFGSGGPSGQRFHTLHGSYKDSDVAVVDAVEDLSDVAASVAQVGANRGTSSASSLLRAYAGLKPVLVRSIKKSKYVAFDSLLFGCTAKSSLKAPHIQGLGRACVPNFSKFCANQLLHSCVRGLQQERFSAA